MNVIESKNVTKKFGNIKAVDDLSFVIKESEITGLVGRNGAGKTTMLKIVAGFLKAESGEIKVFLENPFNSITVSANTIFIDDMMSFSTTLNLMEILHSADGFYRNWSMKLAIRLADYFSLNIRQHHRCLSKGMKSTFNMIVGIASRCALTIFDEPTTGMDVAVRKDFYRALLKDYMEFPRTIIISSHLLNEIEGILEKIILIKDGSVCLHMPMINLKEYAVGIKGSASKINSIVSQGEIIYSETYGKNNLYVVIKKDEDTNKFENAKTDGLKFVPVSADDLCVYLTAGTKGGIDDVFKRD